MSEEFINSVIAAGYANMIGALVVDVVCKNLNFGGNLGYAK